MAQTKEGAIKVAAKRIGVTLEEYKSKLADGLKWCHKCKVWKPTARFNTDKSRWDGLKAQCQDCTRVKIRKSTKGRPSAFKDKHHTEETKQKLSQANRGKQARLGIKHSIESRIKMSQTKRKRGSAVSGPVHYAYKDGKLAERRGQRFSAEYKRWRFDVFARDKFTCQKCGDKKGGNLIAHHIKPFADYPELRFDAGNGQTLCKDCHKKLHCSNPK